jgi:Niemann-Pick C1 protein
MLSMLTAVNGYWACRSTFEAPIEPKMVLGGYPTDDSFVSYQQNATALLLTFPMNASARIQQHAVDWERHLLHTVRVKVSLRVTVARYCATCLLVLASPIVTH